MEGYFTIGEFAKLRGININSLFYYEKIGILKPAYVNPQTRYRYYAPDQLAVLDRILMAVYLGIPLKDMNRYIDADGTLLDKDLLLDAKRLAEEKLKDLQQKRDGIAGELNSIVENEKYMGCSGEYKRVFPDRQTVMMPLKEESLSKQGIIRASGQLFAYAQKYALYPVFPGGLVVKIEEGKSEMNVFFELLYSETEDERVSTIPGGAYRCIPVSTQDFVKNIPEMLCKSFQSREGYFVVTNMYCGKYNVKNQAQQLQMLDSKNPACKP